MRTFQIPQGSAPITGNISAGQVVAFPFVDPSTGAPLQVPSSDGVRMNQKWQIYSIYLPVAVKVPTAVTGISLTITATIAGVPVWSTSLQPALTTLPGWNAASTSIGPTDLVNPFELGTGQRLGFNVSATLANAITAGSGTEVRIGAVFDDPSISFLPQPGLVNYDVIVDPRIPQPA